MTLLQLKDFRVWASNERKANATVDRHCILCYIMFQSQIQKRQRKTFKTRDNIRKPLGYMTHELKEQSNFLLDPHLVCSFSKDYTYLPQAFWQMGR